ncbi:MAG: glycoside hydrolase family 16 protein [Clostridia bacterium]|nr:glycoside hydrolase family 16 protein [Clostridia bacterium]
MRIRKFFAAIIAAVTFISALAFFGCKKSEPFDLDLDSMELTFEDNFDGDSLDESKWNYGFAVGEGKKSSPRKGGFWAQDGVFVENGNLILRTQWREKGENGAGWYSGTVMTCEEAGESLDEQLFSQRYGYFEIRCKTPFFYGGWCAFWLMPFDHFADEHNDQQSSKHLNTGIDGTEIDIFESAFSFQRNSNVVNHAVHYDGYMDYLKSVGKLNVKVPRLYEEYHTYGLEWTEEYYKFYIDGVMTWKITSDGYVKNGKKTKHNIVSQVKEYMILSFEVVSPEKEGSTKGWCGDPSDNDKNKVYDFAIDYVRVYA